MAMGLFQKLKEGLKKTRDVLNTDIRDLMNGKKLDDDMLEQLEELMISSDMGVKFSMQVVETIAGAYKNKEFSDADDIIDILKAEVGKVMQSVDRSIQQAESGPTIVLVAGVNGTGKTTSIAKLANLFHKEGKKVLLAAGDTFRAAAVEQLTIWAERIGVDIVKHDAGADPAAVCFDAIDAGIARGTDIIIVDTAGRLHTQVNLMNELEKIHRVISNKIPDAPHETLLVIDATTGQNGIQQAKKFDEAIKLNGIILSKLDGTAKGGVVVGIESEMDIPVKFIGVGEGLDDLSAFDPKEFVTALFAD